MILHEAQSAALAAIATALLTLGCAWSAPGSARAQQAGPCRAADAFAAGTIPWLDSLMTGSDSLNASLRAKLRVTRTTSSEIALVTEQSVCTNAARAVDVAVGHVQNGRRVYVFKARTHYMVFDPESLDTELDGGYRQHFFFTSSWTYLGAAVR